MTNYSIPSNDEKEEAICDVIANQKADKHKKQATPKLFSVILPIYKNEDNLPITISYIIDHLDLFSNYDVEIIMVCDGSPDNSWEIMKQLQKEHPSLITVANMSRNYGQGACVVAAASLAKGDVIGVISADLQDPFELFKDMLTYWEQGFAHVYGTRVSREEKGILAFCSRMMHRIMRKHVIRDWPQGGSDFYIMDAKLWREYIKYSTNKYNSGLPLRLKLSDHRKEIPYVRKKREVGKSGFTFKGKIAMAYNWVLIDSSLAINFVYAISGILFLLCLILLFTAIAIRSNVMLIAGVILLSASAMILCIGIVLSYVYRIFNIAKNTPRFIIDEIIEKTT